MTVPASITPSPPLPKAPKHPQGIQRTLRGIGLAILSFMALSIVLLAGLLLFLHSSGSGQSIARLTASLVNGLDTGLHLEVESIELDWPLTLKIRNVQLRDSEGLWLEVPYAESALSPRSLLPKAPLHWQVHSTRTLVRQATWYRLPVLPPVSDVAAETVSSASPASLTLLPAWLSIAVDTALLENLRLGAPALALQPVVPYIQPFYIVRLRAQAMVSAVTGNLTANAEIQPEIIAENPETTETPQASLLTRLHLKANFADNTITLQTTIQDKALLWPHMQPHLPPQPATQDNVAPELDIQGTLSAYLPSVPPTRQAPLSLQWHMNLTAPPLSPASLQGSLSLNSKGLEWEKVALHYPAATAEKDSVPSVSVSTGGSFDFDNGPVAQLSVNIGDISVLQEFGLNLPQVSGPLHSSVQLNTAASPDQPYLQWEVSSPALALAQGSLHEASLKLLARVPVHPSATPAASVAWTLPTSFNGTLEAAVQSCMGLGPAKASAQWGLDYGKSLELNLAKVQASLLGASLSGKFHSIGTQVKDAALDLVVTDTTTIARLANISLKGSPLTVKARLVPATAAKDSSLKGQITVGAGSYDAVQWLSGEGSFEVNPTAANLSMTVKGKLSARLRCSYNFAKESLRIENLELSESSKKIGAKLQKPTELCFANGFSIDKTDITLRPAGQVFVNGKLTSHLLDLEASVEKIPLSLAKAFLSAPLPHGLVAAQVNIKGSPASPTGKLALQVADIPLATTVGSPRASLHVDGTLARANTGTSSHSLNLKARWEGIDSLKNFDASAQIPLRFTPVPSPAMNAPLRANVFWQGEINPLWRLVPLPGRSLSGKAEIQAQVRGSLHTPQLSGHVFVGQGKFVDSLEGILLDAIQLEARYGEQGQSLLRLHATDGRGGTVALEGTLSDLPTASAPSSASSSKATTQKSGEYLALRGIINKLRPLRRDDVAIQLSGAIDISGPLQAPLIAGNICVDQALVQLLDGFGGKTVKTLPVQDISALRTPQTAVRAAQADRLAQGVIAAAVEAPSPTGPHCNLRINAPGRLYIRGKGLDSEWKAALSITGPLDAPRILGSVTPIRGQLEVLGHQFTLASGGISFSGSNPPNPALDLTLEYKGNDITALIMLSGSAKQPKMRLNSQPVLPNDEIIAHILFGKDINSLSRFEALQAANTARQLVDFGPSALDFMTSTRDILGLEVLRLGSTAGNRQSRAPRDASLQGTNSTNPDDQAPTIEAGKYILDNVYVGLDQGTSANSGTAVRVEVELLPNLSLEGRTSNESSGVGINWKHDY